jgi:hypothetical protein
VWGALLWAGVVARQYTHFDDTYTLRMINSFIFSMNETNILKNWIKICVSFTKFGHQALLMTKFNLSWMPAVTRQN